MTDLLTPQDRELLSESSKHAPFGEYDRMGGFWGDEFDLVDAAFAHCGYSNQPMPPVSIPSRLRWMRNGGARTSTVFATDTMIPSTGWRDGGKKPVAWLLEPLALNASLYKWVKDNAHLFYAILSHDVDYFSPPAVSQDHPEFAPNAARPSNFLWVPFGGCWVPKKEWCHKFKSTVLEEPIEHAGPVRIMSVRNDARQLPMGINIIASTKNFTEGHRLRHEVIAAAKAAGLPLEAVGGGYKPFERVFDATNLRYQVVIENDKRNGYFTEKIINCFARGVVPIYWGCPDLAKYGFSEDHMYRFDSVDDLVKRVIPGILKREDAGGPPIDVTVNRAVMERYVLAEDYIYEKYVDLFR